MTRRQSHEYISAVHRAFRIGMVGGMAAMAVLSLILLAGLAWERQLAREAIVQQEASVQW